MEASACIGVKLHVGVLPVTVMTDRNPTPEEASRICVAHGMTASGTKRTYRDVRYRSAFERKADISQRLANNRDL